MKKLIKYIIAGLIVSTFFSCNTSEKIGVLYIDVGTPPQHKVDWYVGFFEVFPDIFFPGWFAGGPLEGGDCYTLIHYANEAEAVMCGVEEGTPIDAFCNEYVGDYPVQSLLDFGPDGDNSFEDNCYSPAMPFPFVVLQGHTTIDPGTGEEIVAPVIADPDAPGIGVADFIELSAFNRMDWLYRLPDYTDPHRELSLKMYYGNDAPGYAPDTPELTNIKDRLAEMFPDGELVFRHGWEGYMEDLDAYRNPTTISDSTETAIRELIEEEKVDRIVVFHPSPTFTNSVQYGHDWLDENGKGISALPDKTFRECIEDPTDGIGPSSQAEIETFLTHKPWEEHAKHLFPLVVNLAEKIDSGIPVSFAPPSGIFEEYELAALEMVEHTIKKYSIPRDAALKVIVPTHGFYGAYMNAQACDCYFSLTEPTMNRFTSRIKSELDWSGTLEVVSTGVEFAEAHYDFPSADKPFGDAMSVGEIVDSSLNGVYVDTMGRVVDNGLDNFDYIIINPQGRTESQDTIYGMRSEILGNNIHKGMSFYQRDEADQDGTDYNAGDIDQDYFTVRIFDGTGWPSYTGCLEDPEGCEGSEPVYKGSQEKPTTVIICGAITANSANAGRKNLIEAAAQSILKAIRNPNARGVK
jgi:hypothetical protein